MENYIGLRPFTPDDWMAFCGTEGSNPKVAYFDFSDWNYAVICDAEGLVVFRTLIIVDDSAFGYSHGLDGPEELQQMFRIECEQSFAEDLAVAFLGDEVKTKRVIDSMKWSEL